MDVNTKEVRKVSNIYILQFLVSLPTIFLGVLTIAICRLNEV